MSEVEDAYRVAPRDLRGSSAKVIEFGEFLFEFNPLTGDVMVTSRTQELVVEGLRPGAARLMSKRRDPNVGVRV